MNTKTIYYRGDYDEQDKYCRCCGSELKIVELNFAKKFDSSTGQKLSYVTKRCVKTTLFGFYACRTHACDL